MSIVAGIEAAAKAYSNRTGGQLLGITLPLEDYAHALSNSICEHCHQSPPQKDSFVLYLQGGVPIKVSCG